MHESAGLVCADLVASVLVPKASVLVQKASVLVPKASAVSHVVLDLVAGTVSSFGIVVRSVVVHVVPQVVVVVEVVPFLPVVGSCSTVVAQADTENLRTDVVVA